MSSPDRKLFLERPDEVRGARDQGYTGVYVGSAFCERCLPSPREVEAVVAAARDHGLSCHLVTPYLTEATFDRAVELARAFAAAAPGAEVVVNDLGFLSLVAEELPALTPVAGRVLARQKSDPRLLRLLQGAFAGADLREKVRALGHVSVNSPAFAAFLATLRVGRVELQSTPQEPDLRSDAFRYSLHVPYVFVSSSPYCPPPQQLTKAGRMPVTAVCERHCADGYHRLRSTDRHATEFLLRGNTIYAASDQGRRPARVDRIVVHRLPS